MTMQNDTSMACASGSDISVLISIHKGENDKYNGPQHTFVKWIILKLKFKLSLIFISQVFALCYLTSEFAK